jgi:hypothetical protein
LHLQKVRRVGDGAANVLGMIAGPWAIFKLASL